MPAHQLANQFYRRLVRLIGLTLIALAVSLSAPGSALAQTSPPAWTEPDLLAPAPDQFRVRPFVAADHYGTVHAIWHEGEDLGGSGNWRIETIYYSQWDGSMWSAPVDILAASGGTGGNMGQARSLVVTPDDWLLIARANDGYVVISQTPLHDAANARSWTSMRIDLGAGPALAVSRDGTIWCMAYWVNTFTSLVLSCSSNQGQTWDAPKTVWTAQPNTAGNNVELIVADDGRVHLVWSEPSQERSWNSGAIWHAVAEPGSEDFSVREVMRSASRDEPNLDTPNLAECPNGQIHLVWNNSVGSSTGRFHQYSGPGGDNWSDVTAIFPGLSGLTSKPGLVCDNTGRVHLVTAAAGFGTSTSPIRYATWRDGAWSNFSTLWNGRFYGERPSLTIVSGNQLQLVWDSFQGRDLIGGRFIAQSSRFIDADPIPPAQQAPESARISPTQPTATPVTPTAVPPVFVAENSAVVDRTFPTQSDPLPSQVHPVVISIIPVIILVLFALVRFRPHGRR